MEHIVRVGRDLVIVNPSDETIDTWVLFNKMSKIKKDFEPYIVTPDTSGQCQSRLKEEPELKTDYEKQKMREYIDLELEIETKRMRGKKCND